MSQISIPEALQRAGRHHQAGEFAQAETLYRQVLAADPNNAQALHLLGFLALQTGHHAAAVDLIRQSISVEPNDPDAHFHLAHSLKELGHLPESVAAYERSLALFPDSPEILSALAGVLHVLNRIPEAIDRYKQATALKPDFVDPVHNLGLIWAQLGRWEEAVACYKRAIALRPDLPEPHNNIALAYRASGQTTQAIDHFGQAIALRPEFPDALNNLGSLLWDQGRHLDEALEYLYRAVALAPNLAPAHCNLGTAILGLGRPEDAARSFQRAISLQPNDAQAHSRFLFSLIFHPGYDGPATRQANHEWYLRHAQRFQSSIKPFPNDRAPDRRLRIGYLSPHFHEHCQSFFTLPLLAHHDHQRFEIFCYPSSNHEDAITGRIRRSADAWHPITGLDDDRAAALIRQDKIDILVDLTMHLDSHRILIFARKPAPVQITWLAYPGTTGLPSIDYRITDPQLDPPIPPGLHDSWYVEKSLRLPETFWCYDPLISDMPVNALPALSAGHITFGSLNNFAKVSDITLKMWSRVLKAVPRSELTLLVDSGPHRRYALNLFAAHGVAPDRIHPVSRMSRRDYLAAYHKIDLCLDTHPCPGHTTTLDALWMGVPVVTLPGKTAVGRGGLSILSNIGLLEFIAHTPDEFVRIATQLAQNLPRLAEVRATLRPRLEKSPLMDAARFTRNMEAAYRTAWQTYCATK